MYIPDSIGYFFKALNGFLESGMIFGLFPG